MPKASPTEVHTFPTRRAFVLQLSTQADLSQGRIYGRVEHISSGRARRCGSIEELLAFITSVLEENQSKQEEEI
ncbi:MAG: hypothetical protein FJ147_00040 [Deltaproteobacteria bacterium]|nr:hypothetical protein [Deltaproteobacteria bacterium]